MFLEGSGSHLGRPNLGKTGEWAPKEGAVFKYRTSNPFRKVDPPQAQVPKNGSLKIADVHNVHQQIKRLLFLGLKSKVIAEKLGVSDVLVNSVKNSPVIKMQLEVMQAAADAESVDLKKQISSLAPHALVNLQEVIVQGTLNGEPVKPVTILKESNNVLDRHMGKPTQNIRSESFNAFFTADDIKELKQKAMEQACKQDTIDI